MKKSHFTIIELLLVISIAGVMLSVAVPAFSRMIKGSASGIAVRELMGKINAARSYAISNGTYVALVFPGKSGDTSDFQKRFGYRAYRVCEVAPDGTGYRFLRWIPGENWQYFPGGILLGYGTGDEPPVKAKNDDEKTADGTANIHSGLSCNIGGRSYSEESGTPKNIANYLVFRPDGMTDQFPNPILLRLRDGKVDSEGAASDVSGGYYPLVVRFNGKPKAYNELVGE